MMSLSTADSALLLRARRLAKRSRAETACFLCKGSKSRCNDYRPCARCKKSGARLCLDLPSSAPSAPRDISSASASNRSCTLTSRLTNIAQPPAKLDDSLRWHLFSLPPTIRSPVPIHPHHTTSHSLCTRSFTPLGPMLAQTVQPADAILAFEQVRRSIERGCRSSMRLNGSQCAGSRDSRVICLDHGPRVTATFKSSLRA
jgi:hypothetical protein